MHTLRILIIAAGIFAALTPPANGTFACSRSRPFQVEELLQATVVVRATAVSYVGPAPPRSRSTGEPETVVRFRIDEVLRGSDVPPALEIHGYLVETDDFNDVPVPYTFIRPGGRHGSCIANTYRAGAQHLLFLRVREGRLTPYWCPLGPVNEQVRSTDDPWLLWVRQYLARHAAATPPN